jgi:uncharacterized membrane protein
MKKRMYYALISSVIGLLGLLNSGYLTYSELSGNLPVCSPPFQCRSVLESAWFNLGPIPLPAVGVLFFGAVLAAGVITYLKNDQTTDDDLSPVPGEKVLWYLALMGAGFASYTMIVMGVFIQGWCIYCLVSDGLLGGNLILNLWYRRSDKAKAAHTN